MSAPGDPTSHSTTSPGTPGSTTDEGPVTGSITLPSPQGRDLIVVTGMSGAGRSTTAHVLEDIGWYVVDNLPAQMLVPLVDLLERAASRGHELPTVAAVVDVRSHIFTEGLKEGLDELRQRGWNPRVFFVDATDESLVRRFESVRRPHPLQGEGRLLDGIRRERDLLGDMRSQADVVVDTSGYNVHQLAAKVNEILGTGDTSRMRIAVMSFGFKYGLPLDADIVLDLRFLPNPYWIPELRQFTGKDPAVSEFVLAQTGAEDFLRRAQDMLEPMIAGYQREGRRYITLAVGCTGGKHRSVAMAEELSRRVATGDVVTVTIHRDLGRE